MFVTIYFEWRGMRFGDNVGKFMYLVPDLEASIGAESDAQALSMTGLYLRQYLIIECDE